jgi:hypothetical protein
MWYRTLAALAAAVTTAAAAAISLPTAAPVAAPPVRIMVVGDSISNGFSGDFTWRYRLWQQLRDSGLAADFVGPFQTVYNPTSQLQDLTYADPVFDREHDATIGRFASQEKDTIGGYVATFQPDVLLVNLGTNDLTFGAQTGTQVAASMATLIGNARAARPSVQIVLSKLARLSDPAWAAKWTDYNTRLQALAVQLTTPSSPVVIVDPNDFGYDPAVHSKDGVHPNAAGEWLYAASFYNGLGQLRILPPPRTRPAPSTGTPPMPDPVTRPIPTGPPPLP